MPDTPLMGPNGQAAIDAQTGMPLTMEEMLRRRGIVRMGNTTSMVGPSTTDPATQAATASPPTTTPVDTASNGSAGPSPAVLAAMLQRSGMTPPQPQGATPQPQAMGAVPGALPNGGQDFDPSSLIAGGAGVAGGAAGTALLYKLLGNRGADTATGMPLSGNIIDADYTDVPNAPKKLTTNVAKRISSGGKPILNAPQKWLTGPSQADTTAASKAIAARGNMTVPEQGGVSEDAYAGLRRTLKHTVPKSAPSEALDSGLLRTLQRIAKGL